MPKKSQINEYSYCLQGMTNNVRFTSSVGDNYTGNSQLVLNKTIRIGDTKDDI